MKKIVHLFFLVPLTINALNLQDWITLYMGGTVGQLVAYGNVLLVAGGSLLLIKKNKRIMKTASLWVFFFAVHYAISILASALYHNPADIGYTIVNIIFYFGFLIYLGVIKELYNLHRFLNWTFLIASIFLIILWNLQIDLDYIHLDLNWGLDRASGLYGDANNACLVSIISYIFLKFTDFSKSLYLKVFKNIMIAIVCYSIFLTFSTTGYLVFVIVLVLCNYKYLTQKNIFISMCVLPLLYLGLMNLTSLTSGLNLNVRQQSKITNFENIFAFNFEEIDNSGRGEHIDKVIDELYENPFWGHGFDFGLRNLTHNTYLNIWLESGIIGLLTLLTILLIYFSRTIKTDAKIRYFSLAILLTISIFMLSLQTVINQPYLMVVLTYLGFLIDENIIEKKHEKLSTKILQ